MIPEKTIGYVKIKKLLTGNFQPGAFNFVFLSAPVGRLR